MGVGDSSRNSKTEEVCEQRSGEWTVLCDLRYRRSVHDIWITGAKRSLAFLFAAIYATVIEWVAGHLIEKAFKARWWDYSKIRWNLDGYICIPASLVWGALGYLGIRWGNRFAIVVFKMLPLFLMKILVLILLGILIVDILGSYLLLRGKGKNLARWEATNEGLDRVSDKLGRMISTWVGKRIQKAYPKAVELIRKEEEAEKGKVFAAGCGFYKIVLLFLSEHFLEILQRRFSAGSRQVCG